MLHEALKQMRIFHGYKQNELANKLDISASYISEIESGKKPVSIELLEKYAQIYSIPASSLLLFAENMETAKASDNFRLNFANKIVKVMEWINVRYSDPAES